MSKSRLRQAVLRDLAWLFNATRPGGRVDLRADAARPPIGHQLRPAGAVGARGVVARRRRARARHPSGDPRFRAAHPARDAPGEGARARERSSTTTTSIGVEIRGELWAQPVPLELLVRTEIDLETGKVEIADLARRERRDGSAAARHYNLELQHLREMGAEFAQQFPKIAARLGMSGLEVADPYVERLLEGVRVPGRARPAQARRRVPALHAGAARDRLSALPGADAVDAGRAAASRIPTIPALATGARSCRAARRCRARSAATTGPPASSAPRTTSTLWPIEIVVASYFSFAPDLPLNALPLARADQGRRAHPAARRRRAEVLAAAARPPDASICTGADDVANQLYELCLGDTRRRARAAGRAAPAPWHEFAAGRPASGRRLRRREALLPVTLRVVPGLPAAAGVLRVSRSAIASSRCSGSARAIRRAQRQRDRARPAVRPRRARASRASSTRRTSRCSARRRSICFRSAPIGST